MRLFTSRGSSESALGAAPTALYTSSHLPGTHNGARCCLKANCEWSRCPIKYIFASETCQRCPNIEPLTIDLVVAKPTLTENTSLSYTLLAS